MTKEQTEACEKLAEKLIDELFYLKARKQEILYKDIDDKDIFKAGFQAAQTLKELGDL